MRQPEAKFEALVYTENQEVAVRCAAAFAEFPVDWIMFDDPALAIEYLSRDRFDFVFLDLDSSAETSILTQVVESGINLRSVVLAVTAAPADPAMLALCYSSQIFYPVRPGNIEEELYRSAPFAERISAQASRNHTAQPCHYQLIEEFDASASSGYVSALLVQAKRFGATSTAFLWNLYQRKHSLSTSAQVRVASIMASIGTIWFIQEVTQNFRGAQYMGPPPAGPTYLIALASLLWLCAKHRKVFNSSTEAVA